MCNRMDSPVRNNKSVWTVIQSLPFLGVVGTPQGIKKDDSTYVIL